MNINHEEGTKRGSYYIEENGKRIAEIVYNWFSEDGIIIEHTEVDPSLEGQGIGAKLVDAVVEMAREKGAKIMPLCAFALARFKRKPEYADVWHNH